MAKSPTKGGSGFSVSYPVISSRGGSMLEGNLMRSVVTLRINPVLDVY